MKAPRTLLAVVVGCALVVVTNTNAQTAPAVVDATAEAGYTAKIEARAADILTALDLQDAAKAGRVRAELLGQYRRLRAWHDANDARLKTLAKTASSTNAAEAATAKAELVVCRASLKSIHEGFLAALAKDLSPAQVEAVKDKMTYGKVKVTYDAYCALVPTLTESQKEQMLATLKEAREEAMDAGSSEEKSAVFNRYKGRINNFLSKEGVDMGKASKDWAARQKGTNAPAK
jgi:hypothetical protein